MRPVRILPADIYDTLELSALAFGGIGRDEFFSFGPGHVIEAPNCAWGHAILADGDSGMPTKLMWHNNALTMALHEVGIYPEDNDAAVGFSERISFKQWCRRLNVVRGIQ